MRAPGRRDDNPPAPVWDVDWGNVGEIRTFGARKDDPAARYKVAACLFALFNDRRPIMPAMIFSLAKESPRYLLARKI